MDESVDLNFLTDSIIYKDEKPYYINKDLPDGLPDTNIEYECHSNQIITDIRGKENIFSLDTTGFQYFKWTPPPVNWKSEASIKEHYLPAIKKLVNETLGGNLIKCHIFDWRMRCASSVAALQDLNGAEHEQLRKIAPAFIVHVDQSPKGVIDYIHRMFGRDAIDLLQHRVRLVNVWLPLVRKVENNSLALCSATTAKSSDFLTVDAVGAKHVREILMAKYSENFKWYYMSHMGQEDVCIFKVWDSDPAVEAKFVPHCSFDHVKYCNPDAQPRESVECRVLVISE